MTIRELMHRLMDLDPEMEVNIQCKGGLETFLANDIDVVETWAYQPKEGEAYMANWKKTDGFPNKKVACIMRDLWSK